MTTQPKYTIEKTIKEMNDHKLSISEIINNTTNV